MDLKNKLKYYHSGKTKTASGTEHHYKNLFTTIGGRVLDADTLPIIKIEKFEYFHHFDPMALYDQFSEVNLPLLTKNQFPDPLYLKNLLIFDLETTGLAGGTGTYPFLLGFGIFKENGIQLIQYFLPEFGREIGAYIDIKDICEEKTTLLSYNGKSFDYPLLRNRFILNRFDNPLEHYVHLDLLHLTRRLWKNVLPSCSLQTIEERIFSFNRWQDIDGSLIPQAYFNFLQTGDSSEIKRIINHNQQDMVSLARLLIHLHHIENNDVIPVYPDHELVAMFDLAVNISDTDRAEPMMKKLGSLQKNIPGRSLKKYSLLLKRREKWEEALAIWRSFIESGEEILFAFEELAKYYEHRERHYTRAIDFTDRALKYIEIITELEDLGNLDETSDRFAQRKKRLQKKVKYKNKIC